MRSCEHIKITTSRLLGASYICRCRVWIMQMQMQMLGGLVVAAGAAAPGFDAHGVQGGDPG
jgi:hypothetical protein